MLALATPWDGQPLDWCGLPSHQLPSDLQRLQNEIVKRRPSTIVEVGAGAGGTTRFLADVCQLLDHGRVIAVEEMDYAAPMYPRIQWHRGESVASVGKLRPTGPTMVILDSDVYSERHCLDELRAYAPLVTPGQLLIACHADRSDWGMRPAVAKFLEQHREFSLVVDQRPTLHAWMVRQ